MQKNLQKKQIKFPNENLKYKFQRQKIEIQDDTKGTLGGLTDVETKTEGKTTLFIYTKVIRELESKRQQDAGVDNQRQ